MARGPRSWAGARSSDYARSRSKPAAHAGRCTCRWGWPRGEMKSVHRACWHKPAPRHAGSTATITQRPPRTPPSRAPRRPPPSASSPKAAPRPCSDARDLHNHNPVLSGSELWLLRLMADRGLALLDASTLAMVVEERGELRVAAASGRVSVRVGVLPMEGSALGALYMTGKALSLERPRGQEATWLHELGLEARAVLVEPFSLEG